MPYKDQYQDGSFTLFEHENEDFLFSEPLRKQCYQALEATAEEHHLVTDTKYQLSRIAVKYASRGREAHQAIYFLQELHDKFPTVQNQYYDDLVSAGWEASISNPELSQRLLLAAGIRYHD